LKHSRSSAEVEIRDAVVVARFRQLWPDARIIHEMNVEHGSSRADVVAVQQERIWICEIKSERDTLSRVAGQVADFGPSCHGLIVAAHEKWTRRDYVDVPARVTRSGIRRGGYKQQQPSLLMQATKNCAHFDTWTYPEPYQGDWHAPYASRVPWLDRMLGLLWSDEIRSVAAEHRIACTKRSPTYKLAPEMSRLLTGREIERAVCKHLRARTFVEADPPIEIVRKVVPAHPASIRQESMF
jgi:hypothetical protein